MQEDSGLRPFFSIILPFYNARATLRHACLSCLCQHFDNFELILVDDGSSDDSSQCVENELQDSRVTLLRLPHNSGVSSARNHGISQARGYYLAFMDADDQWDPAKLEVMATVIRSRPDVSFFFHNSRVGFESERNNSAIGGHPEVETVSFIRWLVKNRAHTPCVIVKNDESVRFNEFLRYSEDYDLWLALAFSNKSLRVNRVLTHLGRRVGTHGGLSANKWQMRLGEIRCYLRLYRLHPLLTMIVPALVMWSLAKHVRSIILFNRLSG